MRIMKKALLALVLCLIALCVAGLLPTPALAQEPKETNPPTILFIISGDESDSGNDGNTPENDLQPALEKYINKDVHQDLPAFDTPFTYEITSASAASLTIIARSDAGEAQAAVKRGQSVYRVYNSQTGTYHYTTREEEVNRLLKAGSKDGELMASTVSNSQPIQVPTGSAITAYDDDSVSVGPMIADQRQMLESALAADSSYTPNGVADIWAMISPDGEEKNVGPDEVDALVKQGWKRKYLVGQGTLLNGENGTAFFAFSPADVIITGKAHVNAVVADTAAEGSTIIVDSDTQVDNLVAAGDDTTVTLEGGAQVDNFVVTGTNSTVNIEGGAQVDKLEVAGDNVSVTIEAYGRVDEMMVEASGATIRIDGTVDQVIQTGSASGTVYSGTGTVTNAVMEAVSTGLSTLNCPFMVWPEGAGMISNLMGDYTAVANPGYRFLGWVFNGTASVSLPLVLDYTSESLPMFFLESLTSLGSSPCCVIAMFEKTDEASPSTDSKKTGMSLLAFITNGDEGQPEVTDPADTQEGPNSAESDVVAAQPAGHEHIWDEWTQTKAPTCTEKGQETHTCQVEDCGETETREIAIDSAAHPADKIVEDAAVAATCTEKGKTAGSHCSACNAVVTAQQETDVDPHPADKIVEDAAVAATCTEKGKTAGKHCSVCNTVITAQEVIPAKGHTPVDDAAVPATCTEPGKTAGSHCSVCNAVLVAQEIESALGHTGGEATCLAKAICTRCNQPYGDFGAHKMEEVEPAMEPNCENPGKTAYYRCSVCEEAKIPSEEYGTPLGHDWGAWSQTKAPTCTGKGEESHTCKRSGCGATETRPVDELGHAWATIWTQGETTHYHACTRDDCIAKNDEAEHSYNEDHECSVCGATEPVFVVGE